MVSTEIYLTGAGGFIGQAVMRAQAPTARRVPLSRQDALERIRNRRPGPASLLHLAWPDLRGSASTGAGGGGPSEDEWQAFFQWTVELAKTCAESGVSFIGIGSGLDAYVDGELAEPYLTYVRRKIALHAAASAFGDIAWIRLHFVFGRGENPGRLIPAAIAAGLAGEPFACGARDRRRCWIDVDDLAASLIDFALSPTPGITDIAGREPLSFEDLFSLLEEALGRRLTLIDPALPLADGRLKLVAPVNLAQNLPLEIGLRDNLLARLKAYADMIAAAGSTVR